MHAVMQRLEDDVLLGHTHASTDSLVGGLGHESPLRMDTGADAAPGSRVGRLALERQGREEVGRS